MSTYLIGDIHGCYISLKKLLNKVSFEPKKDTLWITGDLVAKGPNSLKVLKLIYSLKKNVKIVLGNHDLNLLRIYSNITSKNQKKNTTNIDIFNILKSSLANELINWLRYQPILQIDEEKKIIMTHAGINPKWNIYQAKKFAKEIENILQNKLYSIFLHNINYNKNIITKILNIKTEDLIRIQSNINIFTRMRYILPNGKLDMDYKGVPEKAPYSLTPWFNIPGLIFPKYNLIFGHWSSLKGKGTPLGIYGLDSGCYQGGKLTLLEWENKKFIHISCNQNSL